MQPQRFLMRACGYLLAGAVLSACQTAPQSAPKAEVAVAAEAAAAADAPCTVSQSAFNHIYQRHCTPSSGADQLLGVYCQNAASAQQFCRMVQSAPSKYRVVQPDGRIRYDANLGKVVGTAGQRCGRMIMDTSGNVVTEFPESSNAPPTC
ncbi:hypothetical protein [Paracidovorax anthurii]|uniref:Uncharacterized protein n=1 Tax=Paracidovorax anthurii TaxID=78229 RepID=A0A328Z121_9BURK|nr:hypothetical protein [Paracidovorax anthurii]RAR79143.1 hypothetical protein AX018_102734 [Paracidovorax anthurii]WCM95194.1 hypothetical protein M5C99_10985 [Acidovorax sp. NCPPB 2350]